MGMFRAIKPAVSKGLSAPIAMGRRIQNETRAGAAGLGGMKMGGKGHVGSSTNTAGLNARKGWERGSMQRQGVVGAEAHGAGSRVASTTAHVSRNRKAYVVGGGAVAGGAGGAAVGGAYDKRRQRNYY